MPALVFNKCCGCIELKTGCFIIGYMNLVITIIATIMATLFLIGGSVISTQGDKKDQETGIVVMIGSSIILIFLLILLAFLITLLVGLHKNKPGHVRAYVIYSMVFLVIYTIQVISSFFGDVMPGVIFQQICTIILNIYFTLVIRSQYHHMKGPARGPAIYSA